MNAAVAKPQLWSYLFDESDVTRPLVELFLPQKKLKENQDKNKSKRKNANKNGSEIIAFIFPATGATSFCLPFEYSQNLWEFLEATANIRWGLEGAGSQHRFVISII